jgi:single-strand DNA-binding protein
MANLNRVHLIGNLTRDPEVRYTPKGTAVADIGLAINRSWKSDDDEKKEEVTFVDVTLWGRVAEVAQEYLKKGRPVFIEGRLHLDTWEDQSGQKRTKLKVIGESLQLLGGRAESEGGSGPPPSQQRTAAPPQRQRQHDPDLDVEPDDIPF